MGNNKPVLEREIDEAYGFKTLSKRYKRMRKQGSKEGVDSKGVGLAEGFERKDEDEKNVGDAKPSQASPVSTVSAVPAGREARRRCTEALTPGSTSRRRRSCPPCSSKWWRRRWRS